MIKQSHRLQWLGLLLILLTSSAQAQFKVAVFTTPFVLSQKFKLLEQAANSKG